VQPGNGRPGRLEDADEIAEVRDDPPHAELTGSLLAHRVLADWQVSERFVKVMPKDYKRMLQAFPRDRNCRFERRTSRDGGLRAQQQDLVRASGN
jgi:glutamate synthase (NADPH) large chain